MSKNPTAYAYGYKGPAAQDIAPIGAVQDGDKYRLLTAGKTVVTPPAPPTGATKVSIDASDPLEVGPNPTFRETEYTIPDGMTFYLQFIAAGAEGDPTESGSKVEVYYDVNGTRHLVERSHLTGFTVAVAYDDLDEARDGTVMVGSGTLNKIVVRRQRMSTSANEIDAVVRGYVQ